MRGRVVVAVTVVAGGLAMAAACSSFEEAPSNDATAEGGADSGSGASEAGGADALSPDGGGGCNGRVGPSLCSGMACDLALRKNTCCLPADGGAEYCSTIAFTDCPGAQQNCASSDDCPIVGNQCCQTGSTPGASSCRASCGSAAVFCARNSECDGGTCVAPTGQQPYWHCGPCTL